MQTFDEEAKQYEVMTKGDYDVVDFYNKRVDMYEEVILAAGHQDPTLVVEVIEKLEMSKDCKIMEFGCGTGLFGEALSEKGYKNVDGLDGSVEMLNRAKDKAVYNHLAELYLGIPDKFPEKYHGVYDIVAAMSCLGPQHI